MRKFLKFALARSIAILAMVLFPVIALMGYVLMNAIHERVTLGDSAEVAGHLIGILWKGEL